MKKYSLTKRESSRPSYSAKRWYIFLLLTGVLVFALLLPRLFSFVGTVVMVPVHGVVTWIRESPAFIPYFVRDRMALRAEVDVLQSRLDATVGIESTALRLQEENVALRSSLGEFNELRLLTRVVARPPFMAYDFLQIDKGSDQGVEVGAPVYAGHDVVVGMVSQVSNSYAFVQLVSSPGSEVTVFVSGATVFATMEGVGSGAARVRLSPSVRVAPGDLVLLSAIDSGIFGVITHVVNEPTQPEQFAYVSLPVSLQSLRYLTVGKKLITARTLPEAEESTRKQLQALLWIPDAYDYVVATTTTSTDVISTTSPTL